MEPELKNPWLKTLFEAFLHTWGQSGGQMQLFGAGRKELEAAFYEALQPVKTVLGIAEHAGPEYECPVCEAWRFQEGPRHANGCVLDRLLRELEAHS